MEEWRFIDTGYLTAAENMALDETLLELRAKDLIPDTVRLLWFDPPAVLVGYHQDIEQEIRLDYVEHKGIEINRRITGGGSIFFDTYSMGWEIVASKKSISSSSQEEIFETMCNGVVQALNTLGVPAEFRPKNDIEVNGKKISGTGGTQRGSAFLFQGTLLIDFDVETMVRALRIPIEKLKHKELESAKDRVTWVTRELGSMPPMEELRTALKAGFEQALGITLKDGELTPVEENLLKEKLPEFQDEEWIYLDRRPDGESAAVRSLGKLPGGLVRISLVIDRSVRLIKSALITGDFFVFPSRGILDLEAALKFTPCTEESIRKIVAEFFKSNTVEMPWIKPDDIADLIIEAAERAEFEEYGITIDEANDIYPIGKRIKDLLNNDYDHLLLPYCSKLIDCEFRRTEGCTICGECSIGDAYNEADILGMKPITIQSFEHLIEELREMKKIGAKGFIGSCCEAFYAKHRDEMEEVGVPGLIIDIDSTTCYDLGKEDEAYAGSFENQTCLKSELVSKVLKIVKNRKAGS
jgi:lipoate-protein ligase A